VDVRELQPDEYGRVCHLFGDHEVDRAMIHSILECHSPGRVWADDGTHPEAAIVRHPVGDCYVAGKSDRQTVATLVAAGPGRAGLADHGKLVLTPGSPQLEQTIRCLWPQVGRVEWMGLSFDREGFEVARRSFGRLGEAVTIERIDQRLARRADRELGTTIEQVWGSVERFVTQGFGFCMTEGRQLVSACWSYAIGAGLGEIDITTAASFRGQGRATATCIVYIQHCLTNGLLPIWNCRKDNPASAAVARKLGFRPSLRFAQLLMQCADIV